MTTFVTTDQKSTQKTPPIDDVCNNTHQSTPKTQHARPLRCPRGEAGPGCGAHGRQRHRRLPNFARNLSWSFFETPQKHCNSNDANSMFEQAAGELRAKWMGGSRAWPGFEPTPPSQTPATQRSRCGGYRRDGGPGCGARGRWRGGLRDDVPSDAPATQAPPVWTAPEGPEGTGGLRDRPLRAFRLACGDLAGGRALRRPEHQRRNKQQHAARMARGADVSRAGRRPRAHQAARPSRAHQAARTHNAAARPQPGYATKSSPSEPCARAGASRQGQSGCAPRCAAPRLRYR